jgi:hypothetical protein
MSRNGQFRVQYLQDSTAKWVRYHHLLRHRLLADAEVRQGYHKCHLQ